MLDLLDQDGSGASSPNAILDVIQSTQRSNNAGVNSVLPLTGTSHQYDMIEEEKSAMSSGAGGVASRFYKDSNRKQSQANQKKRQPGDD